MRTKWNRVAECEATLAEKDKRIAELAAALNRAEAQLANVSARLKLLSDECSDASFAAYKVRDI